MAQSRNNPRRLAKSVWLLGILAFAAPALRVAAGRGNERRRQDVAASDDLPRRVRGRADDPAGEGPGVHALRSLGLRAGRHRPSGAAATPQFAGGGAASVLTVMRGARSDTPSGMARSEAMTAM